MEVREMKKGLIIGACVAAAMMLCVFSYYGYLNSLRSEKIAYETQLNAQYLSNQNYLSAYISGFYEQVGVVNLKSEKMDSILTDAVKGRYDQQGGFAPNKNALFSAIHEAYPDVSGLNIYDKIVDYIASHREGYRAIQDKLLDILREYDFWRQDGFVQSWVVENVLGVPSDTLEARIGTDIAKGKAARDRMYQIVLAQQSRDAYKTGTMEPLKVPGK